MSIPRFARRPTTPAIIGADRRLALSEVAELNNQLDEVYSYLANVSSLTGPAAQASAVVTSLQNGSTGALVQGAIIFSGINGIVITVSGQTFTFNGSAFMATANFVDMETPVGAIDGVNRDFTLASSPNPQASAIIVVAYSPAQAGLVSIAHTWPAANQFRLPVAPPAGAAIRVWYRK